MDNYGNHLILRMEFVKVVSSHQLYLTCSLMTFLINMINMEFLLVINAIVEVFFFADNIVLLLQQDSQLKKLVKVSLGKWARNNNEIQFSINKFTNFVV